MTKDTGGPAFPCSNEQFTAGNSYTGDAAPGMTLLDYFAGQALLSAPDYQKSSDPALTAKWAFEVAVEMVAEKRRHGHS